MAQLTSLDRLAATTRTDRATPRLPLGLGQIDRTLGGGLEVGALHEIRTAEARAIGAATGVLAGLLAKVVRRTGRSRILWITDPAAVADAGLLYPDGLAQYGLDPGGLILVQPRDLKGALWAADEGARCTELAAVVVQVRGNPARLDRVATRRLMIRARSSGVFTVILRQSGAAEANAAATRWRVEPQPSLRDPGLPRGVGRPHHALVLERSRDGRSGRWPVIWDPKRQVFERGRTAEGARTERATDEPAPAAQGNGGKGATVSLHRSALSGDRPAGAGALGRVVDFGRPA